MNKANWETEAELRERLTRLSPEALPDYLRAQAGALICSPRPFSDYVRGRVREKGLLQQEVFLAADLSENYGYKLIAEEKHTVRRDVILRICLAVTERVNRKLLSVGG